MPRPVKHLLMTVALLFPASLVTQPSVLFAPPPQRPDGGFFTRCLADPMQADCLAAFLIPCLCLGLLLVAIVVGVVLIARRGKHDGEKAPRVPTTTPADTTSSPPDSGTLVVAKGVPSKPDYIAILRVVEGPADQSGKDIFIRQNVVKLGRDPAKADITFYAGLKSSVSSLHCSLRHYRERFYMTDHGSTNGTRVNDETLERETPHEVQSGDEIVLGDTSAMGVKLIFTRQGEAPPPAESDGEQTVLDDRPFDPGDLPSAPGDAPARDDDRTHFDSPAS